MLPDREELEYSLPSDERTYKACPMSRWDNNLINLLFGSSLRSLRMLRAAKLSFLATKGAEETFKTDLQAILDASVEDFENAFRINVTAAPSRFLKCSQLRKRK